MIPPVLYDQIVALMPIPSVEAMILRGNSLLFLRRKNSPLRGEWWFPGGRIRKGETFEKTLFRKVKEETGLSVETVRLSASTTEFFPRDTIYQWFFSTDTSTAPLH